MMKTIMKITKQLRAITRFKKLKEISMQEREKSKNAR
jgi:hypothetical protein